MALNLNFYKEIIEKEKTWLTNLEYNLLNVYYLPELRDFYVSKQETLRDEAKLTGNILMNNISNTMENMVLKLNELIDSHHLGNEIDLKELNNYFLTNVLSNKYVEEKKQHNDTKKIDEIVEHKSTLYDLRQKLTDLNNEDYMDDDFYYGGRAV